MHESTGDSWLEMVYEFHFHFEHPVAPKAGRIIPEPRRVARTKWLLEELIEFMAADNVVDQTKEALDFLYFCWGNFIEIGLGDASFLDMELASVFRSTGCPRPMEYPHRASFAKRAAESIFAFAHSDTRQGQLDFTTDAARTMVRCLGVMNVDPRDLMEIVHDSNMGKLWADGKPKFADDGKVVKPPHFEKAEPGIERIIDKRVEAYKKEHEDDELPF